MLDKAIVGSVKACLQTQLTEEQRPLFSKHVISCLKLCYQPIPTDKVAVEAALGRVLKAIGPQKSDGFQFLWFDTDIKAYIEALKVPDAERVYTLYQFGSRPLAWVALLLAELTFGSEVLGDANFRLEIYPAYGEKRMPEKSDLELILRSVWSLYGGSRDGKHFLVASPKEVHLKDGLLHSEEGPAVVFCTEGTSYDGHEEYYLKGERMGKTIWEYKLGLPKEKAAPKVDLSGVCPHCGKGI